MILTDRGYNQPPLYIMGERHARLHCLSNTQCYMPAWHFRAWRSKFFSV
jgi:hypothetical protein